MTPAEQTLAALVIGIALATCGAMCGDAPDAHADAGQPTEAQLYVALRSTVAVGTPRSVPVAHCRRAGSPMPGAGVWARCDRRLHAFAGYFLEAARAEHVSAWTLAAMAVRESGLNPMAEGGVGEGGLMQLHPRGIGARVPFVRSERVRRVCARDVGACQRDIVRIGAHHLSGWSRRCGSEAAALGGYNRGSCGETDYARRVASTRARLMAAEGGER